ncbi:MAG TPA: nucleotide exchange factor GrpE [Nitrospiria bacterium]|nr:nucleotide exchange factor GrpE [Nitrospiria bacterium]
MDDSEIKINREEPDSQDARRRFEDLEKTLPEQAPGEETLDEEKSRLSAELGEKEREFKELYDRHIRTVADFENYKKRALKDQAEFSKFANEKLLKELLPVVDNLERAIASSKETREISKLIEGVDLIKKQFLDVLSKFGVTALESLGEPFDPHRHQAVSQIEGEGADENRVVAEAQKGYLMHDRLLRPAMVAVSKKRETGSKNSGEPGS